MKKISLVVLLILLYLPIGVNAFESTALRKKTFDETIDSVLSKRMELPLVRSKLENPNSKFVPVYGHVMDANDTRSLDITEDEDMFVAESLFLVLNDRMLQKSFSRAERSHAAKERFPFEKGDPGCPKSVQTLNEPIQFYQSRKN